MHLTDDILTMHAMYSSSPFVEVRFIHYISSHIGLEGTRHEDLFKTSRTCDVQELVI